MSVINSVPLIASGDDGYNIIRSVRLRSSASAYFNRTLSSGNRKTWTWSGWVKRGSLSSTQWLFDADNGSTDSTEFNFAIGSGDTLIVAGSLTTWRVTTQVFRDPSAWYHIVLAVDTSQATANNRIRLYVNGSEVTAFSTLNNPTLNLDLAVNQAIAHYIGIRTGLTSPLNGYLTEVNFIDGQQLTPSSFGETDAVTGVWKPKKYAGTYGTNGFYLNFSDNSNNTAATIGKDYSGNGNNWTPNNISVTSGVTYDSMLDVPTPYADGGNGRGNYAVWNPLDKRASGSTTYADGNLSSTVGASASTEEAYVTMSFPTSGKWYCEVTVSNIASGNARIGIGNIAVAVDTRAANGYFYQQDGQKYVLGTASAYGSSWTTNDIIGVAFDADAGSITFYKNNTSQGAITGISTTAQWIIGATGKATVLAANFGQRPFAYTPPTGFKALNTQNLPAPTILKGNLWFNAVTWTGNGVDGRTITGVGFNPDLVWAKGRSNTGAHVLADAVRGTNANLYTNLTDAETNPTTGASGGGIGSVTTDGFVLEQGTTNMDLVNTSSRTYVGWTWKESATAGFDIVTYTGDGVSSRTVAHSLGVTPAMIITKPRSASGDWFVAHRSLGNGNLILNQTLQSYNPATQFSGGGLAAPNSSTTFSFAAGSGGVGNANANGTTYVAYLFAEVAGFSRFGSYTGNGSTDGPFVFCGFRPRWIMVKRTDTTGDWWVWDAARNTFNAMNFYLSPNRSDAEFTANTVDFTSNGIKFRDSSSGWNASGGTYIFAAFAEHPFKNALAR